MIYEKKFAGVISIALLGFAIVGCGPTRTAPTSESNATTASLPETPPFEAKLETVNVAGYDAAIAECKGSVVLVDFWGTTCLPCMERFPETVGWSKEYAEQGLKVISVSLDDERNMKTVKTFLSDEKADFRNLISQWGFGVESMDRFQIPGGIPFYRLYDRSGNLRYEFTGIPPAGLDNVEEFEQIEPRMKELLAEPAA